MSLKFFFNRKGKVVLGMTVIGWALTIWNLLNLSHEWVFRGAFTSYLFLFYVLLAFLITLTRFYPWYASKDRGAGIEEHFEKTLVPVAYILTAVGIISRLWMSPWLFLILFSVFFLLILYVNSVLIYFHLQDKDPIAPSFFARNLYLKN